ncbi:MAG TPA: type IV secretory system conjugative DNA transfer family protein [Candidatus Angelobacter sp.]|nr:type IV secretory system conjugative DNA transfer family protein [Candidatus Angelobacter sp.]
MRSLVLGHGPDGRQITIDPDDRQAHMHVIGSSGSGKSKFLEWIMRQDLKNRQGFCLIDPHGTLYHDILNYCGHKVLERDIVLLDLSDPAHIIGFNPFKKAAQGDVSVQVDRRISATMHAWGVENTDDTPTLERTLRLIYTALIEQDVSFHHSQYLIDFNSHAIRAELFSSIMSPLVRREWEELQGLKPKDFRSEVLSAKNRLFRLLTSKTLARFLNAKGQPLDLADIIEKGKVLLVNLAPSDHLSADNAKVFGALLVNEFFEVARRRVPEYGQDLKPYFLYLDEFQTFVSLDITKMLDQVRKYKLFTVLAHQRFGQLDQDLMDAVLTNCRIKAVFGGLPVESAELMARELFIGELDPMKVKVAIYQTKFWPKYSRDKVYGYSQSTGRSTGRGDNRALSEGMGMVQGEFFNPQDWFASDPTARSMVMSQTSAMVSGQHTSETDFSGEGESVADVPIMLPVPFQELSSLQFYTKEEQLTELTAALKEQFGRHCFIKIHHEKTQPMRVPFVEGFNPPESNLRWYVQRLLKASNAASAETVDQEIAREEAALARPRHEAPQQIKTKPQEQSFAWTDILGKE